MFETAELGQKVSRDAFDRAAPTLRLSLVQAQQALRRADFSVIVVFAGVDGAGKSESMNLINEWIDPRWIVTRAYGDPSDEERERPDYWRYWRDLPSRGQMGLFRSSWYSDPVLMQIYGKQSERVFDRRLRQIVAFERMLAADGALLLKFWMHLGKKAQRKRLRQLQSDPNQKWRVTRRDWANWRRYDQFIAAAERAIMRTNTGFAPWTIVEGSDARYRTLRVLTTVHEALIAALGRNAEALRVGRRAKRKTVSGSEPARKTILQALDLGKQLTTKKYRTQLERQRARLAELHRKAMRNSVSTVAVFEGWDASGKGGTIRRMTAALDARHYRVVPIAAPSDEERAHHYLWRFWRHLARAGRVTVFDRSWYGRVLVERVEGLATQEQWRRAYGEITQFEAELVAHGVVLVKFFLHIGKDEQLKRFEQRRRTPYKRWKLTADDWRNRRQWDAYELATDEMIGQTSTRIAPWTLVEANDKRYARVKVLRTLCRRLERALKKR